MSKYNQILEHLKEGKSITGAEAFAMFGVYRLSSVINRIRKDHDVKTEMVTEKDYTYAKYSMR